MPTLEESLSHQPVELNFGTSGLRALVTHMTDLECYLNTLGFVHFLQAHDGLQPGETVYIAGDLRDSTPRIMRAVAQALLDAELEVVNCGLIPTPALAYYALLHESPGIMVTGSHIPADRNGIKFYKRKGEVLKADEADIKTAVAEVRHKLYEEPFETSAFDEHGVLRQKVELPAEISEPKRTYVDRHVTVFGSRALAGKRLVFYQHSAVGRDLLVELLEKLGAEVIPVGRSDVFVPIDSENVTPDDQAYFRQLAAEYRGCCAIVSTDGDSDRPFLIDEHGNFHRGDVLGGVVATWLKADFAAYPVSSSDAVDTYLSEHQIPISRTRIGSPYIVAAMQEGQATGRKRTVAWEVNGGFMIGNDFMVSGKELKALPTRDAIFPIIVALMAAQNGNFTVSELFAQLPARYTQAGLIDDFPTELSARIVQHFATDSPETRAELERYFTPALGYADVTDINVLDGIRITFSNGDIAHLRPSGNAPQLRIYGIADSQKRADEIVAQALVEPDGIFRTIQATLAG